MSLVGRSLDDSVLFECSIMKKKSKAIPLTSSLDPRQRSLEGFGKTNFFCRLERQHLHARKVTEFNKVKGINRQLNTYLLPCVHCPTKQYVVARLKQSLSQETRSRSGEKRFGA